MNRIFITGVEGSGTTMLSRILSNPTTSASLLGNYISEKIKKDNYVNKIIQDLSVMTQSLWDTNGNMFDFEDASIAIPIIIQDLENHLKTNYEITSFIYKRSSPFLNGNRYIPDLLDVQKLFNKPKIIVMVRDPKQSSYSALRRGFLNDIKQCAIVCHINLTLLNSTINSLENVFVINYNDFCKDYSKTLPRFSEFLGIDSNILLNSIHKESLNSSNQDKYLKNLDLKSINFLNTYFNSERMKSYNFLEI